MRFPRLSGMSGICSGGREDCKLASGAAVGTPWRLGHANCPPAVIINVTDALHWCRTPAHVTWHSPSPNPPTLSDRVQQARAGRWGLQGLRLHFPLCSQAQCNTHFTHNWCRPFTHIWAQARVLLKWIGVFYRIGCLIVFMLHLYFVHSSKMHG